MALPPAVDLDRLRALLAEWRERIRSEMPIARQMLRVLFPDRIIVIPDAEQETVELRGDCAVGSGFERLLVPRTMVTRRDSNPWSLPRQGDGDSNSPTRAFRADSLAP